MTTALVAVLALAFLAVVALLRSVRIVPQGKAAVVERLGRYVRTQGAGVAILLPFLDRMRPMIDMREQVVSFPPQPVITSDNLTVAIDSVIYFQVTDPRAATYEIQNYIQAVEQLTITTLRNVVGSLNLEQALTSRDGINTQLRGVLDEATGPWGIRVARVEIKAIDPPPSIQDAMEKQMRADRDKRAIILAAEGQREAAIKSAEGQKTAQILAAEGQKRAAILAAEADRQSRILRAEGDRAARYLSAQGQAKAIETTFGAIHAAKPDPALLAYQYLQTLPQIAQGDANKMWIIPTEFSKAVDSLGRLGGDGAAGPDAPSWLTPAPRQTQDAGPPPQPMDTSGWLDERPDSSIEDSGQLYKYDTSDSDPAEPKRPQPPATEPPMAQAPAPEPPVQRPPVPPYLQNPPNTPPAPPSSAF